MRRPILAANWKMHKTRAEALEFVRELLPRLGDAAGVDALIAPPFTALEAVGKALAGSPVGLAAQNGPYDPNYDLDGDGKVDRRDTAIAQVYLFTRPGPSAQARATGR